MDKSKVVKDLTSSCGKTVNYFKSQVQPDGSLLLNADLEEDICRYFKTVMMFVCAGENGLAEKLLAYIEQHFFTADGDFLTNLKSGLKSHLSHYILYWSYCNGWIVRTAKRLSCDSHADMLAKAVQYMEGYHLGDGRGFQTQRISGENKSSDVLSTAHQGLVHLEMGNMPLAHSAASFLLTALEKQTDFKEKGAFYLRFDSSLNPIPYNEYEKGTPVPEMFSRIDLGQENQLYFMLGYPMAFLALMYKECKDERYLDGSKKYFDVFDQCAGDARHSGFSHKVAWACVHLYDITGDERYGKVLVEIMEHFVEIQNGDGLWEGHGSYGAYDQSPEIATWMMEIIHVLQQ